MCRLTTGAGLPSPSIDAVLTDVEIAVRVAYLDGNVMVERDLRRVKVQNASAVFILANKFTDNPDMEDSNSILRAMSVKRSVQQ